MSAVATCRDKYETQMVWRVSGVSSPQSALVQSERDAAAFQESLGRPVVIKPLTGSGSELVMKCSDGIECSRAISTLRRRLSTHHDRRMYSSAESDHDPRTVFVIQEFVSGEEYSCDFVIDGDHVEIIRIAKKIMAGDQPIGTTLAYIVPSALPDGMQLSRFLESLRKAAHAVGLRRSICMLDFIVRDREAVLIELSPRPGGDCLPELLMRSGGFDTIEFALDFALRRDRPIPDTSKWKSLVGLRLIADRGGKIARLDSSEIRRDNRVIECGFKRSVGHIVKLPPDDYDSRVLGHVIFEPHSASTITVECTEIASKLTLEMEDEQWKTQKAS
jgi:glutathione synthase/RimK-type ligase-like ATP-grasp enzyme